MNNASCCCQAGISPCNPPVPTVTTSLTLKDALGAVKVRLGIGRMNYTVNPGLYAIGNPHTESPVMVSANYKLTFDSLRKNLCGFDCWLLILDTKGINVWCAAGKGTFGTSELINQIGTTGLPKVISHRKLIVPQLGASGISAHEVSLRTGFNITFGPIRASDIKAFIASGCKATKEMRTVNFSILDRLVLTPMELVASARVSLMVFGSLFLINLLAARPFGIRDLLAYASAVLVGAVATPILLPFIPGKAFSFKGWLLGLTSITIIAWGYGWFSPPFLLLGIGYLLALPAYSAFLAMNFTGASTYTSPSGVLKEMRIAIPLIAFLLSLGMILILIKTIFG